MASLQDALTKVELAVSESRHTKVAARGFITAALLVGSGVFATVAVAVAVAVAAAVAVVVVAVAVAVGSPVEGVAVGPAGK